MIYPILILELIGCMTLDNSETTWRLRKVFEGLVLSDSIDWWAEFCITTKVMYYGQWDNDINFIH